MASKALPTILRGSGWYVLMSCSLLLAGCATVDTSDIEVVTRTSPQAQFDRYRTYGWLETAEIVNDPFGQWEPPGFDADAVLRELVDRELGRRSMTVADGTPDLLVTFVAGVEMTAFEVHEDGHGAMPSLQTIPKGALVVVLVDAMNRRPVWVGVAGAELKRSQEPEAARRRLDYAVREMFRDFPKP
jgi:hypothetical protein